MPLRGLTALLWMIIAVDAQAGWQAAVGRADITPATPMWMSGYASRDHEATGQLTPLWAKTLVLQDDAGRRGVVITLDLVGIDRQTALGIRDQVMAAHKLTHADIALCTSHTHSGPIVGNNLMAMYELEESQLRLVQEYTAHLQAEVVRIVGEAFNRLQPAELGWGVGTCDFAVNRRENREPDVPALREQGALKGPVDHEVPVLQVRLDGQLEGVLFGYACHATTLSGYDWCGDWPGYAQIAIEEAHPGVTALFFTGCGADQNPLPRRTVELAQAYGGRLARAVGDVLQGDLEPVAPKLSTTYEEISLPFAHVPTRDELVQTLTADNKYEVRRAKHLLGLLGDDASAEVAATYPYPIQSWRLGHVTGVFLGGEVVVDYSLAIKGLETPVQFVAGYANDVMAYIPSERVLTEGGYEGGGSMVYYGLPSPWATGVEQRILEAAERQLRTLTP